MCGVGTRFPLQMEDVHRISVCEVAHHILHLHFDGRGMPAFRSGLRVASQHCHTRDERQQNS